MNSSNEVIVQRKKKGPKYLCLWNSRDPRWLL